MCVSVLCFDVGRSLLWLQSVSDGGKSAVGPLLTAARAAHRREMDGAPATIKFSSSFFLSFSLSFLSKVTVEKRPAYST